MNKVILSIGKDLKKQILNEYIFNQELDNMRDYYLDTIDLIRDFIYNNVEELIDLEFENKDIDEISECVYNGNPLLIIRIHEFINGYNLKKE